MGPGQATTKQTYEDTAFVQAFLKKNGTRFDGSVHVKIEDFARSLTGKRVLDVGCGPGIDSLQFAELGFQVVGVDYSEAMIAAARALRLEHNPPDFRCLDMRQIGDAFPESCFDGAWISAALIHVPESDVPGVLLSNDS